MQFQNQDLLQKVHHTPGDPVRKIDNPHLSSSNPQDAGLPLESGKVLQLLAKLPVVLHISRLQATQYPKLAFQSSDNTPAHVGQEPPNTPASYLPTRLLPDLRHQP